MEITRALRSNNAVWMKLAMMAKLLIKSCDAPSFDRRTIRNQKCFRTDMLLTMNNKITESGKLRTDPSFQSGPMP